MLVSQILGSKGTGDIISVTSDATIGDAARILSEKRIGALVVRSGNGLPEGILSERDIVRELGRQGATCLDNKVADLMTREIVHTTKEERTDAVLQKMTEGRFRHMPVFDGDTLAGVISIGDVVKARLSELSMEKDALEGMIKGF
jgi:CBS domain-containing protein